MNIYDALISSMHIFRLGYEELDLLNITSTFTDSRTNPNIIQYLN